MNHENVPMMSQSIAGQINDDVQEFSDNFDGSAPPVGLDMAGHDTNLMGAKIVMLDSFVVDLLNVDTSAQTFRLKLLINMDWEDDGTIEPEIKAKRGLGRTFLMKSSGIEDSSDLSGGDRSRRPSWMNNRGNSGILAGSEYQNINGSRGTSNAPKTHYKTGKFVLKKECCEEPLACTWNPEVVLVNAIADENPIEAGSKFHGIQMLSGRPVISRSVLYQPECRCEVRKRECTFSILSNFQTYYLTFLVSVHILQLSI